MQNKLAKDFYGHFLFQLDFARIRHGCQEHNKIHFVAVWIGFVVIDQLAVFYYQILRQSINHERETFTIVVPRAIL